MINLNVLLKRWENVMAPPESIDSWQDIWTNTVYWSERDPIYAGNTLLAFMSAQPDECPKEYMDAAILWFLHRDNKPQISQISIFPDWCLEAVAYLDDMPLVESEDEVNIPSEPDSD